MYFHIIKLKSLEIELQLAEIEGRIKEKEKQIDVLRTQSIRESSMAQFDLATAQEELITLNELKRETDEKIQQLNLKAPRSGTLLPVADTDGANPNNPAQGPLRVFDKENSNAYLPGVLI